MNDLHFMDQALHCAAAVRLRTSPNPWVGCVIVCEDGQVFTGGTEPPGGRHAERVALDAAVAAGASTHRACAFVTLEPCSHHGRTPPCAEALIAAGVSRVVVAVTDPDPRVSGRGLSALRAAGIAVEVGIRAEQATEQLLAYLHQRRTGRPFVIVKMATTLDGASAAADGTSQWITGIEARTAVHRLRAESDAIIVGAGTVRTDNPSLTTRLVDGPSPRRIVLGTVPDDAAVHPCLQWTRESGSLHHLLDTLGSEGVLQVLVEGGAHVVGEFHQLGLIDRYVLHLAPALMGASSSVGLAGHVTTPTIDQLWRGTIVSTRLLGGDLEVILQPTPARDTRVDLDNQEAS